MQKAKLKGYGNLIIQLPAGVETEIFIDTDKDGNQVIYAPVMLGIGMSAAKPAVSEIAEPASKKSEPKAVVSGEVLTEDQLKEISVVDLKKMCKEMGIKIPTEGKDSNKKLRLLILDAYKSAPEDEEEDEEEEEIEEVAPPAKKGKGKTKAAAVEEEEEEEEESESVSIELIKETATKLFGGDLDDEEATEVFAPYLTDKAVKKAFTKKLDAWMENDEAEAEALISDLCEVFGVENAVASKKSKGKATKATEPKEVLVEDTDELEKGDRVSVYWKSEKQWFAGTVKSNVKGKCIITYDVDNESEIIDEDEHTKIKKLVD